MSDRHRDPIEVPDDGSYELDVVRSNSELNPATADTSDYQPGKGIGAVVVHHLVTAILVAMALALGGWAYLTFKSASLFEEAGEKRTSPFERYAVDAQVDRFHFALATYNALQGKYPPTLDELVDEGLLSSSDLDYPPGSSTIVYQRIGETYQIVVERTVTTTAPASDTTPDETSGAAATDADAGNNSD